MKTIIKIPDYKILKEGQNLAGIQNSINERFTFEPYDENDSNQVADGGLSAISELSKKYKYFPTSKEELQKICKDLVWEKGYEADLNDIYTGYVADMSELFFDATEFNCNISGWDVSNVVDMHDMFNGCNDFNGNISGWDVSSVENMNGMFSDCQNFNQDLSQWDVSNVKEMSHMFFGCVLFNKNISSWNTSAVKNMSSMFSNCDSFDQDISGWDTHSVEDMEQMFFNCQNFNQDLSQWDVSNVENMYYMFYHCEKFNKDISSWDVSNVKNMSAMFCGCKKFNQDLNKWDTHKVVANICHNSMDYTFYGCNNLKKKPSWYIKNVGLIEKFNFDFDDKDDSKQIVDDDIIFATINTDKLKPKILQWLMNYGVNMNIIEVKTYYDGPGIYVTGDLDLSGKGITYLPYKFIDVAGSFNISNNKLTSCKNLPISVGGKMNINKNFIRSFEDLPTKRVGHSIEADHQKCKTLYPLTDANARIMIAEGSDESLRKNRVRVALENENYAYGTILGLNESETAAKVLVDGEAEPIKVSVSMVYPLEKI